MPGQRAREAHREIQLAARRPAARLAEAGHRAVGTHPHPRPQHLARVVVHAGAHVQQHLGVGTLGERIAMHAHAGTGGQLGTHLVIVQPDRVVARLRFLVIMAEAGGIAARLLRIATLQAGTAGERHQQDVAQIGMASAGKMGVREADDAAVVVAVAGRPTVGLLARLDTGIRAELDHAERYRRTRIGVTFATGADERVHRCIGLVGGGSGRRGRSQAGSEHRRGGDSDQETTVQRGHRHLDRFR